ncbi:transglutaminase-like domain-containing protein [Vulgatibacter incomptus]|uniref:Transglutaminase-like domain-containing protein n=1 Tax=Vulgatibacter incomptus TaxID=1391653 RepID=A0A0K1P9T9_9BACT|nr:transglutaminase domain-containing protein [Vulgatibacter incomptus]AKU90196.1 hypothetical protein AKJ08_0583 [Vulgatibacter incomptus]
MRTRRPHAALAFLLSLAIGGCAAKAQELAKEEAPAPLTRVVRLSIRVVGNGGDAYLELPLAQSDEHQTISNEKILGRGFRVEQVMRDGNRLAVLTYPKLEGPRRITYEFTAAMVASTVPVVPVPVSKGGEPPEDDRVWLRPTKQLQSTSPIVREKLIGFAGPKLVEGEDDAIKLAWALSSSGFRRKPDGSKTVLKAVRTGHASDKGLDRLFATFLRTSGVPSRPVIGVEVGRAKAKSRFAHWVEVKSGGRWAPMSVPRDQWGKLPARYVKLAHGDRPFLVRDGVGSVSFHWKVAKPVTTSEATP